MAKRDNTWLIPETIAPANHRCVLIKVPDDRMHLAAFWGALWSLAEWKNWQRDDAHSGALLAGVWKDVIFEAMDRGYDCPEPCPDCPEPEPEPEKSPILGMTCIELEDYLMACIDISGMLKFEGGKLYARNSCCEWVLVPGQTGEIITTQSKPITGRTIRDFINDNSLGLPSLPVPIAPPPGHTTVDSIKCAKATAMVDRFFVVMGDIYTLLGYWALGELTIEAIGLLATELLLTGGQALVYGLANVIFTYVTDQNIDAITDEMQAEINNTVSRANLICQITESMTVGTEITADDLRTFEAAWLTEFDPSTALEAFMIDAIPGEMMRNAMQGAVDDTPCGCNQYKPYGYQAPLGIGCFRATATPYGNLNANTPQAGQSPFPAGQYAAGSGVNWTSKLIESSGGLNYDAISLLIESDKSFTLSDLKITYSTSVSYGGSAADPSVFWFWRYNEGTNQWIRESMYTDWPDGTVPVTKTATAPNASNKWAIMLRAVAQSAQGRNVITVTNITISGMAENGATDIPFADLPLSQEECL